MEASGSARASLSFYNTREEIDGFIDSLQGAIAFFGG
jgi:cysteine desulfurase/selenocysteine lyase